MYKSLSLGDWHEDRVCIYSDDTDEAIGWLSQAQGRELPTDLLNLVRAAPELLAACRLMVALQDGDVHEADTRWKQARKDMRAAIAKAEGRISE